MRLYLNEKIVNEVKIYRINNVHNREKIKYKNNQLFKIIKLLFKNPKYINLLKN